MTPAEHITDERLTEIIKGCEGVTPGPWDVWMESTPSKDRAIDELAHQVNSTPDADFAEAVYLLNANGKCPATTGCGPSSAANAKYLARLDPQTVLSLLTELQHRRAEEAGALKHALERLELFLSTFGDMGERYDTQADIKDWRAALSLAASPSSPASGVRVKVKPMEWHQPWPDDTDPQRGAAVVLGLAYFADRRGAGWTLGLWYWGCGQRRQIGDYDTLALAQAAAQSDYEARVLSALGEHP